MDVDGILPGSLAEHVALPPLPRSRPSSTADGGGLAGPVRAQEAVHLALGDAEVEAVERGVRARIASVGSGLDHVFTTTRVVRLISTAMLRRSSLAQ